MPLNPIAFTDRVVASFLRYQLTAYPFADTRLDIQMRELLSLSKTRSTPLLKGPYLTLSRPFQQGCAVQQLVDGGLLHQLIRERIPEAIQNVYRHQEEAIRSIHSGKTTLVSTGTGSGKTECFLYPIISRCARLRDEKADPGIVAVLVYPMNSLAEDQLLRLRSLLAGTGITFGMYVGKTPEKEEGVTGRRLPAGASRAGYEKAMEDERRLGTGQTVYPAEEVCSRHVMRTQGKQPRILLTNVNQLELLLTRGRDVELFANARLDFMVFDEAHTFTGAQGAETACLIRRLMNFCGKSSGETVCVATSATIADPDVPDAARRFASRFFGVEKDAVRTVGESYADTHWPTDRWSCDAPANPAETLDACVNAVDGDLDALFRAYTQLTGQRLWIAGEDRAASLYDVLSKAQPVFELAKILEKPLPLAETAAQLGKELGRASTEEEVLAWLTLGAMAVKDSRPLLRPVVHAFIRGIGGGSVTFPGTNNEPILHFSTANTANQPSFHRLQLSFHRLQLSTCTTCGQHYFTTHLKGFNHPNNAIPGGGQSSANGGVFWEPMDSAKPGSGRCVLVDELVSGDALPQNATVAPVWLCRSCGTLHAQNDASCGHCASPVPLVPLHSIHSSSAAPGYIGKCLTCDAIGRRMGAGFREPARAVRSTAVADIHVLSQDMLHNLDPKRLLVFCDNRQDAAFQSGWMRDHARRFRLRAMMLDTMEETWSQGNGSKISIGDLVLNLSKILELDAALSKSLVPEVWRVAPQSAQLNHAKERQKFLRMAILRELSMSPRQVLGLEPWGKIRVDYQGLDVGAPFVVSKSRELRLPPDELFNGIASILDYLRRQKVLFDEVHKTFSKFWNDGDSELQNGYLPKMDPPKGTKLTRAATDNESYVVQWQGASGDTYIKQAVRKWGLADAALQSFLQDLFQFLVEVKILKPVKLEGAKGKPVPGQSGLHQIDASVISIASNQGVWKCKRCGRRSTRKTPNAACPAWRCSGTLEFLPENPDDYNLNLLNNRYELVQPEEHTAMVPHERREKIENLFKNPDSKEVNCLVCTQTLEMGVDIGALDAVLMRNVPPLPANYWQRVGRAGRRNRMAVDVTYCRDVSHDRAYFEQPEKLLGGRVDAPVFNLSNALMVNRHIHATMLTWLQQAARTDKDTKATLDMAIPNTVRSWFFNGNTMLQELPDLAALDALIQQNSAAMFEYVRQVFSVGWPAEDSAVVGKEILQEAIRGFCPELKAVMKRVQRRLLWAKNTITKLNQKQESAGTLDSVDESTRRRCERYIKRLKGEMNHGHHEVEGQDDSITYSVLAVEGFLPGYGLERGTILGSAEIPFWEAGQTKDFVLPRPPLLALREYIPGNLIYANGHHFVTRRYQFQPGEERDEIALEVSVANNAMREAGAGAQTNASTQILPSLPLTDAELIHVSQISDEEDYRFQMGVATLGHEKNRHSGGKVFTWGINEVHLIKGMHYRMANIGAKTEIQKRLNFGYLLCPVCGDSVSPMASAKQKQSFHEGHKERCGNNAMDVAKEFAIHTDVVADTLKFPCFANATDAYSVMESLRQAAANCLEMAIEDLQVLVIGNLDNADVSGYLIDPMPGGSGLLEQLIERFGDVHAEALRITENCPAACPTSCTDCLRTYRNSFYHENLDRNAASGFLKASGISLDLSRPMPAIHDIGEAPEGKDAPVNAAERKLRQLLLAAGFPEASWQEPIQLPGPVYYSTTPDAVFRPDDPDGNPVAIYLDGLSRHIHGNPETANKDAVIRQMLRNTNWSVVEITAHDLGDLQAMRSKLRSVANALCLDDLAKEIRTSDGWFERPPVAPAPNPEQERQSTIPFPLLASHARIPGVAYLPVFPDLKIACGSWGEDCSNFGASLDDAEQWLAPLENLKTPAGSFVARVSGKSMEPAIPDGSWCLFSPAPAGDRQGKTLLVCHADIRDADGMGSYTLKKYSSEKQVADSSDDAQWQHASITLSPLNPAYQPILLTPDNEGELRIVAEFRKVLDVPIP